MTDALFNLKGHVALVTGASGGRGRQFALVPGYIITMNRKFFQRAQSAGIIKRMPQRRVGTLEDLDGALLLLASDASSYMTGSIIVVDGDHLQSSL